MNSKTKKKLISLESLGQAAECLRMVQMMLLGHHTVGE